MYEIKRIGKFAAREEINVLNKPYLEVVKYYPNMNYHKFNDFVWNEATEMFDSKANACYHCSPESLILKETCITLLTMDVTEQFDSEPDWESVGNRPIEAVSVQEYHDFCEAVKAMTDYYKTKYTLD